MTETFKVIALVKKMTLLRQTQIIWTYDQKLVEQQVVVLLTILVVNKTLTVISFHLLPNLLSIKLKCMTFIAIQDGFQLILRE